MWADITVTVKKQSDTLAASAQVLLLLTAWCAAQMILSLIVVSVSLAIVGTKVWVAWFILVFVCIYISAYAWYAPDLQLSRLT